MCGMRSHHSPGPGRGERLPVSSQSVRQLPANMQGGKMFACLLALGNGAALVRNLILSTNEISKEKVYYF